MIGRLDRPFTIAANEIPDWHRISSGCSQIDSILGSGIPVNGITEISGYSGAGKTQFCLQLSLVTQLPTSKGGLDRSVVYIATEDIFPAKRLHELAEIWKSYEDVNFEDNIFIQQIDSFVSMTGFTTQQIDNGCGLISYER